MDDYRKQYEKLLRDAQRDGRIAGRTVAQPSSVPMTMNYRAAQNAPAIPSAATSGGEKPTYLGTYDQQLADLYGSISSRPAFSYDATKDPLYQQYKDQYIQGGKLAMKDTMGQAAGLTGGYGSSYGQQVGQQAYDAYLQKLGDVVPELYNSAYNKYADEGNKMMQEYAMLSQMQQDEYNQYLDALNQWQWQQDYDASQTQHAYSQLYSLIGSTGYQPTDDELSAAGMTREAAEALRQEYLRSTGQLEPTGGGYGGGGSDLSDYSPEELQAYLDYLRSLEEEDKPTPAGGSGGSPATKPGIKPIRVIQ